MKKPTLGKEKGSYLLVCLFVAGFLLLLIANRSINGSQGPINYDSG